MKDVIDKSSFPAKGARQDTIARADKGVPAGKANTSLGGRSGMSNIGVTGASRSLEPGPTITVGQSRISREVMTKGHPTAHTRKGR